MSLETTHELDLLFYLRNIATFPSFEIAAKVLGNLKAYQNYLNVRN